MEDLDQGGRPTQKTRVNLGPTLGWIDQEVLPERRIDGSGVINIDPGDSVILLGADGPTRLNLPDVRSWNRQTANQPATGFGRAIWIKDFAGKATTFNITVFPFGSQTIDGTFQSLTLSTNYQALTFYPLDDESGWYSVIQSAGGSGGGGVNNLNATLPLSGTIVGNTLNINIAYDANFALASNQLALASIPSANLLANSLPGAAEPGPTTLTNLLDRVFNAGQGSIVYRGGSVWQSLPPGTSGQVLTTAGASSDPSWQTVTPGGAGNVSNSGTPTNGQWARWTDATHIQGVDSSATGFQPLDGDLTALSALTGTNTIYYRSGVDVWSQVTIGANLTFTGGVLSATGGAGGVPEAPSDGKLYLRQGSSASWQDNALVNQPADGDLSAIAALTGTNTIYYRSGASTWSPVAIGTGLSFGGGTLSASGVSDGDKGDITVSSGGTVWQIDTGVVTNAKLSAMPTANFKARITGGSGDPENITGTQATTLLDLFTSTLKGLVPGSGGGSANFLRADGTWAAPGGASSITIGDTPPGSPVAGNLWWESDTGILWIYYTDSNSSQWVVAAGGGSSTVVQPVQPGTLVQIQRQDISSPVAQVDFTTGINATYDEYEVHFYSVVFAANGALGLRISQDGGATYKAGATDYSYQLAVCMNPSASGSLSGGNVDYLVIGSHNATAGNHVSGLVKFWVPASSTLRKNFMIDADVITTNFATHRGGGYYTPDLNPFNALRFFNPGGNMSAGTFILYGRQK